MSTAQKVVLDAEGIQRAIIRIAHEILEFHHGTHDLALVGVRTRGVHLAERLQKQIHSIEGVTLPLGLLDITLYRDDLREIGPRPEVRQTEIPFNITGQKVVLVDDVLYTGRTVRAALDALTDYGRPLLIQLAVLIDRGHRELPIKADYVGKNIPTSREEEVVLHLKENDGADDAIVRSVPA